MRDTTNSIAKYSLILETVKERFHMVSTKRLQNRIIVTSQIGQKVAKVHSQSFRASLSLLFISLFTS